ncbi:hypothetical protein [Bdellovibrio bacteriovorus]|uniref:hypothetical protein n=1 Tax=Bdellovibrio bacteriovorus TaxID=959 RepID=UPI0035A588DD
MTTLIHLLFYSVMSLAGGDWVGNGGNVIACGDSLRLLDYYEAEEQRRIPLDLGTGTYEFSAKGLLCSASTRERESDPG